MPSGMPTGAKPSGPRPSDGGMMPSGPPGPRPSGMPIGTGMMPMITGTGSAPSVLPALAKLAAVSGGSGTHSKGNKSHKSHGGSKPTGAGKGQKPTGAVESGSEPAPTNLARRADASEAMPSGPEPTGERPTGEKPTGAKRKSVPSVHMSNY